MTNAILRGKLDTGNPHVRFDEGKVASVKPRRGSLFYNKFLTKGCFVLGVMLAVASARADGTIINTGIWNAANKTIWSEGSVPELGPGSTVTLGGTDGYGITFATNHAVIGHLVRGADVTGQSAKTTAFTINASISARENAIAPIYGTKSYGYDTNLCVVFDSGVAGTPSTILMARDEATATFHRLQLRTPIELRNDLELKIQSSAATTISGGISLYGDITEANPGCGLIVNLPTDKRHVVSLRGNNSFTGDVDVRGGHLRLHCRGFNKNEGHQLGANNSIYVTNDNACVDLFGQSVSADHHLYLGGSMIGKTNVLGKLINSWQSPLRTPIWRGPVTLVSNTTIGGNYSDYPAYGRIGNLRIDGPIDGSGFVRIASYDNSTGFGGQGNTVVFAGNNTYTGDTLLYGGRFSFANAAALGNTHVRFYGGTYYVSDENVPDVSVRLNQVTRGSNLARYEVEGGVTHVAQGGFTNVYGIVKSGAGTLKLVKGVPGNEASPQMIVAVGGDLVMDYNNAANLTYTHNWITAFGLMNAGRIVVDTAGKDILHVSKVGLPSWSTGTIRKEGTGKYFLRSLSPDALSVLYLDVAEGNLRYSAKDHPVQTSTGTAPGTLGENIFYNQETWCKTSDTTEISLIQPFTNFATDWATEKGIVDVTSDLLKSPIPADLSVSMLRFNEAANGETLTLNLSGTNTLAGGTIFVTPNFGAGTIVLRGGALKRSTDGVIRIVNLSSNAVVRLETDLVNPDGANVWFGVFGVGKVEFAANSELPSTVGVIGAELVVWDNRFLGTRALNDGNKLKDNQYYKSIALGEGGRLTVHGTVSHKRSLPDGTTVAARFFLSGPGDGILNVADVDGSFIWDGGYESNNIYFMEFRDHARFVKQGPGEFKITSCIRPTACKANVNDMTPFDTYKLFRYRFEGGTVRSTVPTKNIWMENRVLLEVDNNVRLIGSAAFFCFNVGGCNGGGAYDFAPGSFCYSIGKGGVTFDLDGASVGANASDTIGINVVGEVMPEVHCTDLFCGDGPITITNSSATAASFYSSGIGGELYTGKISSYVPMFGQHVANYRCGICWFPLADLYLAKGCSHSSLWLSGDYLESHFASISGEGHIVFEGMDNDMNSVGKIGSDGADSTFDGSFYLMKRSRPAHLVKEGSNAITLTCPTNQFATSIVIRDGALVAGSEGAAGEDGPLGAKMIHLGDERTPANGRPAVLTAGAYTVKNELRVLPYAPASALPRIGSRQTSGISTFSGKVSYWHDVELYAEAGSEVKFTNDFVDKSDGMAKLVKSGAGKVTLTRAPAGSLSLLAGTLEVPGTYVIPAGAQLEVDASLCTKENEDKEFVLLQADSIVGRFVLATPLPNSWNIRYSSSKVILRHSMGMILVVR